MEENKYFDCKCHSIDCLMRFSHFEDESTIYCDLILKKLQFIKRIKGFFLYLLKRPSESDYYSGISFYTHEEYNHQKELIQELNKSINSEHETLKYFSCEIVKNGGTKIATIIQNQQERKEERKFRSITITNPGDLNTLIFMVIEDLEPDKFIETITWVALNRNVSFFKRLWRGFKYLCGRCSQYGLSHEFIITKEAAKEIKETIEIK